MAKQVVVVDRFITQSQARLQASPQEAILVTFSTIISLKIKENLMIWEKFQGHNGEHYLEN